MARIKIEFSTDNAAFEDNPGELEGVLEQIRFVQYSLVNAKVAKQFNLHDSNGNRIGTVDIEIDK